MKKILNSFIKFFITNNYLYKFYLNIPSKNININIQNFNLVLEKKISLNKLMKIEDNYFSKNKVKQTPLQMHSFEWLDDLKHVGGVESLKKSRKLILDWNKNNYKLTSMVWSDILVARRIIKLVSNFDFYGHSANNEFQKIVNKLIYFHYKHLLFLIKIQYQKNEIDLEVSTSILIASKVCRNEKQFIKTINDIKKQIKHQINENSFHKSINTVEQARFIHQLIEIKNILLYYKIRSFSEIDTQIYEMTACLNNMFHRDSSLPLFNGTNNMKSNYVRNIAKTQKDIKTKNLFNINDGIIVVDAKKTKLFFDITKPNSQLLNKKLHSGTLSFEMSDDNEKIITNCGSSEKYLGKNQLFFRYSAAHSTITINDTNIAELSEKNSYKRIPKKINSHSEKLDSYYVVSGSHDGYSKNFNLSIKRTIKIHKDGKRIEGSN